MKLEKLSPVGLEEIGVPDSTRAECSERLPFLRAAELK